MEWAVYGAPKLIFFLNLGWKKKMKKKCYIGLTENKTENICFRSNKTFHLI